VSDFLFSTRPRAPGALGDALGRFVSHASAEIVEMHGTWGSLAVARAPHDPEPVFRDRRHLTVLIGEPMAHLAAGAGPAAEMPRRVSIHQMLAADGGATAWDDVLDGPFAALAIDLERGTGSVVTDLFAWIPLFAAEEGGGVLVGTHVDAVAAVAGAAPDPVSVAELVAHLTITWPETLYDGVRQVAPGTERRFGPGGWADERTYWRPEERFVYGSIDEAAEALRTALVRDVALAAEGRGEIGVLLSGGEDSRAVLGALMGTLPRGAQVTGFTYADDENREVRTARRVAAAYGTTIRFGRREPDHYLRYLEPVSALVGSQNEYIDAHGWELNWRLGLVHLQVVLGGLSSDALLKADNVPPRHFAQVRRGRVPEMRLLPVPRLDGIRRELLEAASERRNAFRRTLMELRPESADEWSRIYPFTMRKYAANHHGNRRMFRVHEPFMSNAVVKLAAAVPQRWKLDRRLFHRAVRPLLAPSWHVPHTRNRFPSLPAPANALARPLLGLARGVRDLATGRRGANQESWPLWDRLVSTDAMASAEARPLLASALRLALEVEDDPRALAAMRTWPARQRLTALQVAYLTGPRA
jgi:hypothetical protein